MSSKKTFMYFFPPALALAGGAWIGCSDSRSDDVFITLGLLLIFNGLLGLDGPRRAWLWPLLVGFWVPVLDGVMPRIVLAPQRPGESFTILSGLAVTGLAMAVCFTGSYLGALLRWSFQNEWQGASRNS